MDRQFDEKYIDKELESIGIRIKKPTGIYLIGGCAMSLRQLKESTKDIDIVFRNKEDYEAFADALFGAQYYEPFTITSEYLHLEAMKMYENKDAFHLDLFVGQVLRKLVLSDSMIKRAEMYKKHGNMEVYLLSKEDVFLFKGFASEGRKRDLADMNVLYPGLDWVALKQELKIQKMPKRLMALFVSRLEEFSRTYKLDVPILRELKKKL